jgi:rubrerythrin
MVGRIKAKLILEGEEEEKEETSRSLDQVEIGEVQRLKDRIESAASHMKKNDMTTYDWTCLECTNQFFKSFIPTSTDKFCPFCGNKNLNRIRRQVR